jgi:hypothetical protein
MIAALYVAKGGCYFGLPDADPWDEARDARLYAGPWPVVAHPPCQRWSKFWFGSTYKVAHGTPRLTKGDDGGCFKAALDAVRTYGGVLEHPAHSHAWRAFNLIAPPDAGGWVVADDRGGWTCRIDQSQFGHRAQKPTWLYAVGCDLPSLPWQRLRIPDPDGRSRRGVLALMGHAERDASPPAFRDLLLGMARSVALRTEAA